MVIYNAAKKNAAITDALNELKRKGYKLEFRREAACIYCFEWQQWIMPENFTVDESYYFQEVSSPMLLQWRKQLKYLKNQFIKQIKL